MIKTPPKSFTSSPNTTAGSLAVVDGDGEFLKDRVPDVFTARSLLFLALQADMGSAIARVEAQRELDGIEPFNPDSLSQAGQAYRTNSNFRFMTVAHLKTMASLRDAISSNPFLVSVETKYGSSQQQALSSVLLSQLMTDMVKSMPGYQSTMDDLLHNFAFHGFGLTYFDDTESWFFNSGGLDDFAFERYTKADPRNLELVFATRMLRAHELMAYIKDEEVARIAGWDVEAVKAVVKYASYNMPNPYKAPENITRMEKNHDFTIGDVVGTAIPISHVWIKQLDGTVSHKIFFVDNQSKTAEGGDFRRDNPEFNEFLFVKEKAYDSMEQAFTMFPFGVSSSGDIHALRGFGNTLLAHVQQLNRFTNSALDIAKIGMSVTVQPKNEMDRLESSVNPLGPYTIIAPGIDVTPVKVPDLNAVSAPIGALQGIMNSVLGELDVTTDGSMGRTQFEAEVRLSNASRLSTHVIDRLMECLSRLFKEIVRRVSVRNYDENLAGYKERQRLLEKMQEYGIPEEALYELDVDATVATPPIGNGSPVKRTLALRACMNYIQFYSEKGQKALIRALTINEVGKKWADMFIPETNQEYANANAQSVAALQNLWLMQGMDVPVLPDEDHRAHAEIHANYIIQLIPSEKLEKEQMARLAPGLQKLVAQLAGHLQYLQARKEFIPAFSQWEKLIARCNEIIVNGMRALEKMQQEAQAQQEAQGAAQGGEQVDPEVLKVQQEMALKEQETQARIAIEQQKAEAEIARKALEANTKAVEVANS